MRLSRILVFGGERTIVTLDHEDKVLEVIQQNYWVELKFTL